MPFARRICGKCVDPAKRLCPPCEDAYREQITTRERTVLDYRRSDIDAAEARGFARGVEAERARVEKVLAEVAHCGWGCALDTVAEIRDALKEAADAER